MWLTITRIPNENAHNRRSGMFFRPQSAIYDRPFVWSSKFDTCKNSQSEKRPER